MLILMLYINCMLMNLLYFLYLSERCVNKKKNETPKVHPNKWEISLSTRIKDIASVSWVEFFLH